MSTPSDQNNVESVNNFLNTILPGELQGRYSENDLIGRVAKNPNQFQDDINGQVAAVNRLALTLLNENNGELRTELQHGAPFPSVSAEQYKSLSVVAEPQVYDYLRTDGILNIRNVHSLRVDAQNGERAYLNNQLQQDMIQELYPNGPELKPLSLPRTGQAISHGAPGSGVPAHVRAKVPQSVTNNITIQYNGDHSGGDLKLPLNNGIVNNNKGTEPATPGGGHP
jgi:hypothetical protein